jgi:hypothetical protein
VQQSKKKETWWRSPLLLCMLLLPWFWQSWLLYSPCSHGTFKQLPSLCIKVLLLL